MSDDPRVPLYFLDGAPVRRCMRSGLCCKTAPCQFGEWDKARHQCRFLEISEQGEDFTLYGCAKKAEIEALPPEAGAMWNPAFGGGCCMPLFNDNRAAIIRDRVARIEGETGRV